MRLLNSNFEFCECDDNPPPYAILSHTWSENNEEEVTYQDLKNGTEKSMHKLELCRDWTKAANIDYFWIDTCCIDKRNDAELAFAIRSMWQWYRDASICFVYLSDLSSKKRKQPGTDWQDSLKDCRWFTRGWTLQELIASKKVEFHARDGYLGSREDLFAALKNITGINLGDQLPDHATRLSWAAKRITKRPEDKAYCMLGICEVSLDPRYGEGGQSAWQRLQDAIAHRHGTIALQVRSAATNPDHRATVLEALRFKALETRRKTVKDALAKTCKWILSHPACAKWMKLEHKFFWIKGKPGSGKSVLIKYLDQHVTRWLKKSNAIGLYFYFNARGEQLEKSFMGLYRSLLVQLVDLVPELAHELDALDIQFDVSQLQSVFASAVRGLGKHIWLFIDALDECREGDVRQLIEFLSGIQEAELYVCLASRHYPTVKVPTDLQLVLEEVDEHGQDLSTYAGQLDLEGEELAQMQREIVAKSNGIFLWVVLVVRLLQEDVDEGRFHAMQSRLRKIPEGLPDLFKTIILRDNKHKNEFLLCLRWILYAQRPLTLKEWYFAMMAGVRGSLEWVERTTDDRMETFLLSSSKGLAELTKGKTITAQFIHESVRDFLVQQGGFEKICGSREALESIAHEELKTCCLRGIAFELPRQLRQRKSKKELLTEEERSSLRDRYPFAEYATTYVWHHADQAAIGCSQEDFLANRLKITDWSSLFNAFQKSKPDLYSEAPSMTYLCAERNLTRLMPRPTDALSPGKQQRYRTPLTAAIVNSSWEVLRVFLSDMNAPNIERTVTEMESKTRWMLSPSTSLMAPWSWALRNGLHQLTKDILAFASKEEVRFHTWESGMTLEGASAGGHNEIVQLLLDKGTHINAGGRFGDALQAAFVKDHKEVLQLLLEKGATFNAKDENLFGNALLAALKSGHKELVQLLLDKGATIKSNALEVASESGNKEVVQLLFDKGADVNAQGGFWGTALQAASRAGQKKIVQLLLDKGADVNAQGGFYGSPLRAASVRSHKEVVHLLRAHGARDMQE